MDCREIAAMKKKQKLDESKMLITFNFYNDEDDSESVYQLPAKFDVCSLCDGKGKVVNPNIDSNGISPEEFDEDPDFKHNYFSGLYDITCPECEGKRVIAIVDEKKSNKATLKLYNKMLEDEYNDIREDIHNREMGY